MKKFISNSAFLYTAGVVFVFALWFIIAFSMGQGNLIFPSPIETFEAWGKLLSTAYFYESIGMSLLRTFYGFALSFALALVLGSLAGEIKPLQRFFKPGLLVLKSAPTAAFVFLFLLLSGSSRAPIWIVSLLAFPILYESVVSGINAVPKELLWAAKVDQGSHWRTLTRVKIPLAAPYIALGLLNSFALSFKTEIMAEIITGDTGAGLGGAIRLYRNLDPSNLAPIFAIALTAILLILIFDGLSALLHRFLRKA
ncbi:MAG: ABC transporter permease subunit [Bacilli bacterium]|nr:ABC transporter permease subunit [Bacilli bacterium]